MSDNTQYTPPWQRPRIATIISIFSGRVAAINTRTREVKVKVNGNEDIPR